MMYYILRDEKIRDASPLKTADTHAHLSPASSQDDLYESRNEKFVQSNYPLLEHDDNNDPHIAEDCEYVSKDVVDLTKSVPPHSNNPWQLDLEFEIINIEKKGKPFKKDANDVELGTNPPEIPEPIRHSDSVPPDADDADFKVPFPKDREPVKSKLSRKKKNPEKLETIKAEKKPSASSDNDNQTDSSTPQPTKEDNGAQGPNPYIKKEPGTEQEKPADSDGATDDVEKQDSKTAARAVGNPFREQKPSRKPQRKAPLSIDELDPKGQKTALFYYYEIRRS